MRGLLNFQRFFVKKLKSIARQQWIERPSDAYIPFNERKLDYLNIKHLREIQKQQTKQDAQPTQNQLRPLSPKMGPYTVTNPRIHNKMYRWCSCGQSLNQPFCDQSHKGSKFKPLKFTIEQNVKQVDLCGCKLTTKKPFCDGLSCKNVSKQSQKQ